MVQFKSVVGFAIGSSIGLVVLGLIFCVSFFVSHRDRIYPGIMIGPVAVGNMTKAEAEMALSTAVTTYQQHWPLVFHTDGRQATVPLSYEAVSYSTDTSVNTAYHFGRGWSWSHLKEFIQLPHQPITIPVEVTIDPVWMTALSASVSAQVNTPAVPPRLEIVGGTATVSAGQAGIELRQEIWQRRMKDSLAKLQIPDQVLEMAVVNPSVTEQQASQAMQWANTLLKTTLTLELNSDELLSKTWKLSGSDLVSFIRLTDDFDQQKIREYVMGVATAVDRQPKDAKFQFDESTGKVKEFVAPEKGLVVNVEQTTRTIEAALQDLVQGKTINPVNLTVQEQDPAVTLSEVNRLGLKERLGVGTSTYKGSIPGRVHNVELAATRLNGTLVKPGETFSFNAAVGEVSAATGYQQAYIIRDGRTQLDDGGGLCQDSTTMFRAALDAGLPIVSRKGHAYRVGYYEQDSKPGFDATVFSPSTDLTFVNDTPAYLLIQTSVDSAARKLTYIIYGTNDGRKATIKDYALWDITPPPPDIYQDDPSLPNGTVKQVDWKAVGSKTKFTYVVERQGQVVFEKTFVTNYKPWASVYLRGTKGQ